VRRSEVFAKGLLELGFGYLLLANVGALVYAVINVDHPGPALCAPAACAVLLVAETVGFLRSPYLRITDPHEDARRVK
jgi:hypothetical protein